jgi:hypothetical protein
MPVMTAFGLGATASYMIYGAIASTAIAIGGSLISGSMQASAYEQQADYQRQQAQYAMDIANYNAEVQRQNAEVSYQLASYQSNVNASIAELSASMALQNQAFAEVQALGAQRQYEQGLANAEQQKIEAEAARRAGEEEARRTRDENDRALALIRSKFASSGVTAEGSPLEVLGDAARFGELAVQDVAYAAELESRKQYKEAEIEEFNANYYLIDKAGYQIEASNFALQAQQYEFQADLHSYESAIAGAAYRIDLNEARLTELAGGVQAWGYESEAAMSETKAQTSLMTGYIGAATAVGTGITSAFSYGAGNIGSTAGTATAGLSSSASAYYTGGDTLSYTRSAGTSAYFKY